MPLRCAANAERLPFRDGSFDLVTANMVVEHLDDPQRQFREIARVTAPGGLFVIHTPNALGYPTVVSRMVPRRLKTGLARYLDGRGNTDVYRTFYRANTGRSLRALASASSFRIEALQFVRSVPVFAFVLPIAVVELAWARLLANERLSRLRGNIIATLEKMDASANMQRA